MVTTTVAFMRRGPLELTNNNVAQFRKVMLLAELKLKFETLAGLYDYLLSLEAVTLKFLESGTIRLSLSYRKRASLLFCLKAA